MHVYYTAVTWRKKARLCISCRQQFDMYLSLMQAAAYYDYKEVMDSDEELDYSAMDQDWRWHASRVLFCRRPGRSDHCRRLEDYPLRSRKWDIGHLGTVQDDQSKQRDPTQQTKNTFWNSRAPPRVQYFTWLLLHGSLQCKANLFQKKIVDDVTCDLCMGHLRLQSICCSSAPFQRPFGRSDATAHDLLHLHRPETLPMAHYDTFILLCHWQLWKWCNGIVSGRRWRPSHSFCKTVR